MITEKAVITASEKLTEGIFSIWIKSGVAGQAGPGQFVMIYPQDGSRLLGRPISICRTCPGKGELNLVFRVAGEGTAEFSALRPGDEVRITGPLGRGFDPGACEGTAFLVGGGIGLPPLLGLGMALAQAGKDFRFVLGYRNSDIFLCDDFVSCGGAERMIIATEDGSAGVRGNVLDAIRAADVSPDLIYSCGPMPMLRALKAYGGEKGIRTFISLEERMACGVGACLGCVCRTVEKDGHSMVNNARICVEGPVFDASEVDI